MAEKTFDVGLSGCNLSERPWGFPKWETRFDDTIPGTDPKIPKG